MASAQVILCKCGEQPAMLLTFLNKAVRDEQKTLALILKSSHQQPGEMDCRTCSLLQLAWSLTVYGAVRRLRNESSNTYHAGLITGRMRMSVLIIMMSSRMSLEANLELIVPGVPKAAVLRWQPQHPQAKQGVSSIFGIGFSFNRERR